MRVGKVFHNIDDSDIYFKYGNFEFYFSRELYLDKFKDEYAQFLEYENNKANIKFKTKIKCDFLFLNLLYKKIEKNGYRILYKGERKNNSYEFILK